MFAQNAQVIRRFAELSPISDFFFSPQFPVCWPLFPQIQPDDVIAHDVFRRLFLAGISVAIEGKIAPSKAFREGNKVFVLSTGTGRGRAM